MANSSKPLRGIIAAFGICAVLIAVMMYMFSQTTGAPDKAPLTGADLTAPAERAE